MTERHNFNREIPKLLAHADRALTMPEIVAQLRAQERGVWRAVVRLYRAGVLVREGEGKARQRYAYRINPQARLASLPGIDSAEGFAEWLEGCGYSPPAGAISWAEILHGYRAYVREWSVPENHSRVG